MDEKTTQVYNFPSNDSNMMPWLATLLNRNGIDGATAAALMNNDGFGGNGLLALIVILAIFNGGFGGFGGFGGNRGGFGMPFMNMLNTDNGIQTVLNALTGNSNDIANLATALNVSTNQVQNGINSVMTNICNLGNQVGLGTSQVINSIQAGNATLANQLCECCCENRLAIANQTNAIQSQMAANHAAATLQAANNHSDDRLDVCQQTNALQNQAERDTTTILNAINAQNTMLAQEFCAIKEREMQDKINTQGDIITQLRGQISNDNQTLAFNKAMDALDDKIDAIASRQPNTVPVVWPNLTAVNNTPYAGGFWGNNYGWGNGFNGYWS